MLIKFTQHSLDRLEERTSLSIYELENIYKAQKTVPLGIEPSSNRQHDLFYSLLDDECYVGVRDVKTHELLWQVKLEKRYCCRYPRQEYRNE